RRHTRFSRDWSSDVCSSDLFENFTAFLLEEGAFVGQVVKTMVGVVAVTADIVGILGELLSVQNTERMWAGAAVLAFNHHGGSARSEERRVGKEWSYRARQDG